MNLLANFWALFLESAPWLLLGLLIAGLIKVWIPLRWIERQLGGNSARTTVKAALLGAPLPLCSCGVIPAALGLRRAGASKSATTAFLVATPETGVDSISVSYALLGPFMAIIRPIAAICSAITAGLLVGRGSAPPASSPTVISSPPPVKRCCTSTVKAEPRTSCCSKTAALQSSVSASSPLARLPTDIRQGVHYAANDLLKDTTVWLLIGLFFAALVQTYVPADFLARWGHGLLGMSLMVMISIPMYICATASTPIAAGLLLSGISPGAVLVFMLAGPATNIATLGVVGRELGSRAIGAYLAGVIGCALLFGALTDLLIGQFGFTVAATIGREHAMMPPWLQQGFGLLLAGLMIRVLWRTYQPLWQRRWSKKPATIR